MFSPNAFVYLSRYAKITGMIRLLFCSKDEKHFIILWRVTLVTCTCVDDEDGAGIFSGHHWATLKVE